ncbi:MAG: tetratricopeptide repeat protein [Flavobacteriales bacterium]
MSLPARLLLPFMGLALLMACGGSKPIAETGGRLPVERTVDGAKDKRAVVMNLFMQATQARLKGDLPKAVQLYQATLKADPQNSASMFELSKLYHQAQAGNEALAMAKKAVATDKDNIWYHFLLADLSTQLGDLPGATKAYRDIVAKWPDRYEVYFGLANALAMQGKITEARQVFRDLEQRTGPTEELLMREYDMLAGAGRIDEARQLLEKAVAEHPDQTQYYGMLAEVYQELGQKDKALEMYQKALAVDPDESMTRISLAQFYYDTGKRPEAFEQLRLAFADPDLDIDPKMQLLLGFYQMTDGEPTDSTRILVDESLALIGIMKKTHPQNGKPYSIEGDFLLREGRKAEAREAFRSALVYEQDKFALWSALVQLDLDLRDYPALHTDAAKASELFPTQPEFHLYDGIALSQMERHDEAIEALIAGRDLVVDNKPLEEQFWSSLGDAYNEAKNYAKSDEAYEKALAIDPDNVSVLNNYAYYLSERNEKLARAEAMSRKAVGIGPDVATYLDTYAWVLYRMGRFTDARTWQEKALAAGGDKDGTLVEHYGDILYRTGDAAGAMEQWKKAKALGGTSEDIDRKLSEGHPVE